MSNSFKCAEKLLIVRGKREYLKDVELILFGLRQSAASHPGQLPIKMEDQDADTLMFTSSPQNAGSFQVNQ